MAQHSRNIYQDSVAIDALNVSNWDSPAVYRSLKSGGVTGINATIAIWEGFAETMDNIAGWMARFREYEDVISQAKTASDILQAKEEGKTGVVFGWQNTAPIGGDLKRLELFHALGVRIVQITYNERNLVGNGCYERNDNGLSNFGLDVVKELNRLGILIDLSHVGDQTSLEAADLSEQPVACTHANARSMFDHPRNKTDERLEFIADHGGFVGVTMFAPFMKRGQDATVADYIEAIEYVIDIVGEERVGIGTDFIQGQNADFFRWITHDKGYARKLVDVGDVYLPRGVETMRDYPKITSAMVDAGWEEPRIRGVLGENWLKLLDEVW